MIKAYFVLKPYKKFYHSKIIFIFYRNSPKNYANNFLRAVFFLCVFILKNLIFFFKNHQKIKIILSLKTVKKGGKIHNSTKLSTFDKPCFMGFRAVFHNENYNIYLFLSTLKAYWEGKKELFEGLAIEKLEKYSLRNAVTYDYFYDSWRPVDEIEALVPAKSWIGKDDYLNQNRNIELKDTAFVYFLHIEEFQGTGKQKPLDFASEEIKEILINLKRVEFINKVKEDLYRQASDKNKINYYYLNSDE